MPKMVNLIGEKFGKLIVVENNGSHNNRVNWLCKCDCGEFTIKNTTALRSGNTNSCGCLKKGPLVKAHGMVKTPEYNTWINIKDRCYNRNSKSYENYGYRGITMCDRWKSSFESFFNDMGYRPTKTHSIDRIDNNGNYSPENCKWSTATEQCNNKRNNRRIEISGEIKTLTEWCRLYSIHTGTVRNRISRGWPVVKALETRPKKNNSYAIKINGEVKNLKQWCCIYDIHYSTVRDRVAHGWSAIDAITTPLRW